MLSCDVDGEGSGAGQHFTSLGLCLSLISSSVLSPSFLARVSIAPWGLYPWVAFWYSCNGEEGGLQYWMVAMPVLWPCWACAYRWPSLFPPHPLLPALLGLS